MYFCNYCHIEIKFNEDKGYITKCPNCGWINRLKDEPEDIEYYGEKQENNVKVDTKKIQTSKIRIERYGEKLLFTYYFDMESLNYFKKQSKTTGQALEKFLDYDKNSLANEEKNNLYKLKASSLEKIRERIKYLQAKIDCIELLRYLDF